MRAFKTHTNTKHTPHAQSQETHTHNTRSPPRPPNRSLFMSHGVRRALEWLAAQLLAWAERSSAAARLAQRGAAAAQPAPSASAASGSSSYRPGPRAGGQGATSSSAAVPAR
jgi:hypothetical protein